MTNQPQTQSFQIYFFFPILCITGWIIRWSWFRELLWVNSKSTRGQTQLSKLILSLHRITFAHVSLGEATHIAEPLVNKGKGILSVVGGSAKGPAYSER